MPKHMHVFEGLPAAPFSVPVVATVGIFDGAHRGHQALLQRLVQAARQKKGLALVVTFWPHPRLVLQQDPHLHLLHTLEEKKERLQALGIDVLVLLPFDKDFANTSQETFVRDILIKKLGTQHLILGYNHRFGKNRAGSYESLQALARQASFTVEQIQEETIENETLSATHIREALREGDMAAVRQALGYTYSFSGTVVAGHRLGTAIGFPTANICMEDAYKLLPRKGVYAVEVQLLADSRPQMEEPRHKGISRSMSRSLSQDASPHLHKGMLYIGRKKIANICEDVIEVNIFDCAKSLYGERLKMICHAYIREEKALRTQDALRRQLLDDKQAVLCALAKIHAPPHPDP